MPAPAGRTLAHSVVTLADDQGICLTVQATTATLGDGPVEWDTPVPDVPSVEECFSLADNAALAPPGVSVPGLVFRVDTRVALATAGWALGQPSGEPLM